MCWNQNLSERVCPFKLSELVREGMPIQVVRTCPRRYAHSSCQNLSERVCPFKLSELVREGMPIQVVRTCPRGYAHSICQNLSERVCPFKLSELVREGMPIQVVRNLKEDWIDSVWLRVQTMLLKNRGPYLGKLNWWKGKPSGIIACTRKQQPRFYWSRSSGVMNDATPLTPPSAWAELHFQM